MAVVRVSTGWREMKRKKGNRPRVEKKNAYYHTRRRQTVCDVYIEIPSQKSKESTTPGHGFTSNTFSCFVFRVPINCLWSLEAGPWTHSCSYSYKRTARDARDARVHAKKWANASRMHGLDCCTPANQKGPRSIHDGVANVCAHLPFGMGFRVRWLETTSRQQQHC